MLRFHIPSDTMDSLIDLFKQKAKQVGTAASIVSTKAKLRADILFLERDIKNRQHAFGVELYDYVSVWSAKPDFFAANEDNILIATLRPPLIQSQREIAALYLKRTKLKEQIGVVSASRSASFNQKSDNIFETVQNAGKTTMFVGNEAKLKAELALIEREINQYKHNFGITMYQQLALLEDAKQWLPTDREIRSFYDSCRKDIDNYKSKISAKEQEIRALDQNADHEGIHLGSNNGGVIDAHQQPGGAPYNVSTNRGGQDHFTSSAPPAFVTVEGHRPGPLLGNSGHQLFASDAGMFRYATNQNNKSGKGGFDDDLY